MITPNPSRVWGVDVSHWNSPPIDFELLKLQGCKFVIIKACDGAAKTRYFEDHYQGAVKAGLVVMMYVWLYPANRVSIDSQVKAWVEVYKSHPEIKLVWVDAEWTNYGGEPANPNASDLTTAQNKLKAQIGNKSGDYTSPGYAREFLKGYVYNNPLWVANYDVLTPTLPAGASTWEFWQFSDNVRSSVGYDTNYYNGTLEQFIAKYGGTGEIPPPTGDKMKLGTIKNGITLNYRSGIGTSYSVLGKLTAGDQVIGIIDTPSGWFKIDHLVINGTIVNPPDGAACSAFADYYFSIVDYIPPVEPPPAESVDVAITVSGAPVGKVTVNGDEWKKV